MHNFPIKNRFDDFHYIYISKSFLCSEKNTNKPREMWKVHDINSSLE